MPFANVEGARLFYRLEGNDGRPTIVFSNSLGTDHAMWDLQAAALLPHFRILRYDTRGHGASDVPAGEYTIERLARDVLDLADSLGIDKFAFCGLSLGGMTGQWLAAHAPNRVTHAVLANTSPRMDSTAMESRRRTVIEQGLSAVVDTVMGRFFMSETLARQEPQAASVRRMILGTNPAGYAGCCAAIRDMDQTASLAGIRVPVLVIGGDHDQSTPWSGHGEILAREIPGARAVHLPTAHLSNLERPRSFNAALFEFLAPSAGSGMDMRRRVLGEAYVDRAIARTTDFTRDFQELITSYAWGSVWTRPGLDVRTRRILVLSITAALGRWEEFRMHLRAGLALELEPSDIKEALLQTAIYAGVPAANTGFQIATEEIQSTCGLKSE